MQDTDFLAGEASENGGDFGPLYERIAPAVYTWARIRIRGRLAQTLEPEDLVQEVFWRALNAFPRFENRRPGAFRYWLFGIATNAYRELNRGGSGGGGGPFAAANDIHRAGDLPAEVRAQITSVTETVRRDERTKRLLESISSLSPDDKMLVLYRGLEGLTAKETAPLISQNVEQVKKRWQRLRAGLAHRDEWKGLL